MLKPCLCIAGGLIGIVVGIKLLFWVDRLNDSPPSSPTCKKLKDDDSRAFYCHKKKYCPTLQKAF